MATRLKTRRKLTLEEFLAMEDTEPASEYACGEVIQKPMPNEPHSAIQLYLAILLFQFLARTKLGRVRPEWRCIFGPPGRRRAYVPDLVYVSAARYRQGRAGDGFLHTAPDLAVEILSPRQSVVRFSAKIRFYLAQGVRSVWVVDPRAMTITVFVPDGDERVLYPGDTLDGGDVLPGFSVPVADVLAQAQE